MSNDRKYRNIQDFPKYQVTSDGKVISYWGKEPRELKAKNKKEGSGYLKVELCKGDGRSHTKYVHKLVAEAFLGPCPNGFVCSHEDGDKYNNAVSNLLYETQEDNLARRAQHGTLPTGLEHHASRLTADEVRQIKKLLTNGHLPDMIAAMFGVNRMTIYRIRNGERYAQV